MKLNKSFRKRLVEEYRFALSRMKSTDEASEKMYFFSVFYGESNRVMNMQWDDHLCLVHTMTQHVFRQADARIKALMAGDTRVPVTKSYFASIEQGLEDLIVYIEDDGTDEELLRILTRLNELSYVSSGNGYYLHLRGGPQT